MQTNVTTPPHFGQSTLDKLAAQKAKLESRIKRLRKSLDSATNDLWRLRKAIDAEKLRAFIGVADAVQLAIRFPSADKIAKHNDTKGTLIAIRRTLCTVDFSGEQWNLRLRDVRPVSGEMQGLVFGVEVAK